MKKLIISCTAILLVLSACKRDDYYKDGGLAKADFNGSMLQYLQSKPIPFDTIAQIVKLAKLDTVFTKDDLTFFAPDDDVIKRTIGTIRSGGLNNLLFNSGRDTVKTLDQIDAAIWKKYLQRYMFRGSNRLKDYPQIDFDVRTVYPGALYYSYANNPTNIGVIFNDANSVKYIGYRQLAISYIPDISKPTENWNTTLVASSDIKPINGVVHALQYKEKYFGFSLYDLFLDVYNKGLKNQ